MILTKHRDHSGYTIMELVVALSVLGLLSGVLISIISVNFKTITDVSDRKKLVTRGMLAINLFQRELGMLKTTDDILIADEQQLKFTDTYGSTWEYLISGNQLTRQEIGVGSAQILAAPLVNATTKFSYFAADNSGLTSLPLGVGDIAQVALVKLILVMDHGTSGIPLMSMVYPENFKMLNR